jgi:hypothetical protein
VEEKGNGQALEDLFYCLVDVERLVVPSFGDEVDGVGLDVGHNQHPQ